MFKWFLRILSGLLLLFLLASIGLFLYIRHSYSPEKIKPTLVTLLQEKSGFDVSIKTLDFTWSGNIRLEKVCFRNAQMQSPRCFVSVEQILLNLKMTALLKKELVVNAVNVSGAALEFFSEKIPQKKGRAQLVYSWQNATRTPLPSTDVQNSDATFFSLSDFHLNTIKITDAKIIQDVQVLGLPLGETFFSFMYRARNSHSVKLELTLPPKGKAILDAQLRVANFSSTLQMFVENFRLNANDRIVGTLTLNDVNAGYIAPSVGLISGVLALSYAGNHLSIKTENTKVFLPTLSSAAFNYIGATTLVLPDAIVRDGVGKLSAEAFVLEYKNLTYALQEGVSLKFTAQTPLASQKILPLPNGLTGFLYAEGQYKKKTPSGALQIKNFSFKESALSFDADTLAMAFEGSTLFVKKQRVRLNKKWPIENLSLRLGVTPSMLSVQNLSMVLARGIINATYVLNRQTKVQNLKFSASHMKAQDLSALFSLKATVFGNVTAAGQLSFAGFNAESIRNSLSGNLALQIGRGKIKDSFFQKGIFTGPLYKLEQKFSDIEFVSGTLDLSFSQGAVNARKVFFDAEEWNVKLRAEADRKGMGKAALQFKFRSTFVENVANPLLLGIENRKEGEFYDLPFACRGNVFSGDCYKQNW